MPNFNKGLNEFYNTVYGMPDFKDISNKISGDGDFQQLVNERAAINNMLNMLFISRGSYPFDPTRGCDLEKYIFDLSSEANRKKIEQEVSETIAPYKTYYSISYDVKYLLNRRGFSINISIKSPKGTSLKKKITYSQDSNGAISTIFEDES